MAEADKQTQPDSEQTKTNSPDQPEVLPKPLPAMIDYRDEGFVIQTTDQRFSLSIQNRLQFRYANPFDDDPRSWSDLALQQSSFMIRRARTKLEGQAYWPWLKFSLQYDWKDPILRDLNLTIDKYPWAKLWLGRGKVLYNDERISSSGRQQFVNRSIVNDLFTVDRQEGLQLSGNLFPGTWHDFSYAIGVFTGLGVGERQNDDTEMMYSGRLQWNLFGGEIPFSQSDLERSAQPTLNLAVAAATNQSKCTAYATGKNSCLALPDFEIGKAGQFRANQMMEELRFRWQGLSVNQELHWKQIIDTTSADNHSRSTDMLGGFLQVGYFPQALMPIMPEQLELAARYAFVDPRYTRQQDLQHEFSGVVTYFLHGHRNKLSLQLSHLIIEDPVQRQSQTGQRLWLQWDLSF